MPLGVHWSDDSEVGKKGKRGACMRRIFVQKLESKLGCKRWQVSGPPGAVHLNSTF